MIAEYLELMKSFVLQVALPICGITGIPTLVLFVVAWWHHKPRATRQQQVVDLIDRFL